MIKICDFPYPIYDQTKNFMYPIYRAVIKLLSRRNIEDVTRNIVEYGQRPCNEGPEGLSF